VQANNCGAADYCNRLVRLPKIRQPLIMIVRLPHPSVGEGISRLSGKVKKYFFSFDNGGDVGNSSGGAPRENLSKRISPMTIVLDTNIFAIY